MRCPALVKAYRQSPTDGEWKVSFPSYDHRNCAGGTKELAARELCCQRRRQMSTIPILSVYSS